MGSSTNGQVVRSGCEAEEKKGASAKGAVINSNGNTIGRAAIVARGECTFSEKARHLEAAGYVAVFVIDNEGDNGGQGPPTPSLGPGSGVTIPVFMLTHHDGHFAASQARASCAYIEVSLK